MFAEWIRRRCRAGCGSSPTSVATLTTPTSSVAASATCTAITCHGSPFRYWYSPTPNCTRVSSNVAAASRAASVPRAFRHSQTATASIRMPNTVAARTCIQVAQ